MRNLHKSTPPIFTSLYGSSLYKVVHLCYSDFQKEVITLATDKPRFSITVDEDTLDRVDAYRGENGISTQSKAIVQLVKKGLEELGLYDDDKKAPLWSSEAMQLARDYDGLDVWGRRAVRNTADLEMERVQEQDAKWTDDEPETEERVIPLFLSAPAAGLASPIMGEDYDDYTVRPQDPPGAVFAVRVDGNSMEPYFPDGSMVFCSKDPLRDGDIGVFSVDGDAVIKQYHHDPALGITYLFSLNRKRADADVVLTRNSGRTLVCLGRVITKHRFPIPGE